MAFFSVNTSGPINQSVTAEGENCLLVSCRLGPRALYVRELMINDIPSNEADLAKYLHSIADDQVLKTFPRIADEIIRDQCAVISEALKIPKSRSLL